MNSREKLYWKLLGDHADGLSAEDAAAKMTAAKPGKPVSKFMIHKINKPWLAAGKLVCSNGVYRRADVVASSPAMTAPTPNGIKAQNMATVLGVLKKLGEGTTDDAERELGVLPNRGINYAFSDLKEAGLIELVRKIEGKNGKGVYRPVDKPADVKPVVVNPPEAEEEEEKMEIEHKNGNKARVPANTPAPRVAEILAALAKAS